MQARDAEAYCRKVGGKVEAKGVVGKVVVAGAMIGDTKWYRYGEVSHVVPPQESHARVCCRTFHRL